MCSWQLILSNTDKGKKHNRLCKETAGSGIPERDFDCVWSDERPVPAEGGVRGSLMQVVAVFGCVLASLVVGDLRRKAAEMRA